MKFSRRFKPAILGQPDDTHMSVGEHLEELRSRIIKALVGVVIGTGVCFYFGDHIFSFVCRPLAAAMTQAGVSPGVVNLTPQEAFVTYFKMSIISGIAVSTPYLFYQIWGFVAVGLYRHERRYVHLYAPASMVFFALGVLFLFYVVLPATLYFFLYFQQRYIPKPAADAGPVGRLLFRSPSTQPIDQPATTSPAAQIPLLSEDLPRCWPWRSDCVSRSRW